MSNLENIKSFMAANKWDEAIAELNNMIKANADKAEAYYLRAKCLSNLDKQMEAMADINHSARLDPTYYDLVTKEADEFGNLNMNPFFRRIAFPEEKISIYVEIMYDGDFKEAESSFLSLIGTNEFNPVVYYHLSICQYQLQEFEKGIEYIDLYIKENPKHSDGYFNKASLFECLDNYDQSITEYKKVLDIEPDHINTKFNLGKVYLNKQEYNTSISFFNEVLELNDQFGIALYNRAIAFAKLNETAKAKADLNSLFIIDPQAKDSALENESLAQLLN